MAEEERNDALAKDTFRVMKETLDEHDWHYEANEENMVIRCGVKGDDLPMTFFMYVYSEQMRVVIKSLLPFSVPEEKRVEMAVAVSVVNNILVSGCFELDMTDGSLYFRISNSYNESPVSTEMLSYMLRLAIALVDDFNDKFFMLTKDMISLEQFIQNPTGGD